MAYGSGGEWVFPFVRIPFSVFVFGLLFGMLLPPLGWLNDDRFTSAYSEQTGPPGIIVFDIKVPN